MLDNLFDAFQKLFTEQPEAEAANEDAVHLAVVALLLEVARSDDDKATLEIEKIKSLLEASMLDGQKTVEETTALIDAASTKVEAAHDLYQFTQVINDRFDYERKAELVHRLWQVAYADGEIQAIEDHIIRRIAGLLHVTHEDFIKEKIRARED